MYALSTPILFSVIPSVPGVAEPHHPRPHPAQRKHHDGSLTDHGSRFSNAVSSTAVYRAKWARRRLAFCFTLRTLLLLAECFRAALADKGAQLLLKLMPEPVRQWWATKGP